MKYHIYIDNEIHPYWGINAAYVKDALKGIKDEEPIDVYICSLGGDVNEALKIRQIFLERKGKVTAYIYGFTASAATIIATGADEIVQSSAALQLVHQASLWVDTFGQLNKEQIAEEIKKLQATAEDLATVDGVIASIYVTRYGITEAAAKELMTAARWLDAKTCKEKGLCDRIAEDTEEPTEGGKQANARRAERFAAMGLPPAPEQEPEHSLTNQQPEQMKQKESKLDAFLNALKALFMGEEEEDPEKKEDPAPEEPEKKEEHEEPEPEKKEDPEEPAEPEKKEDPEEKCDPEKKENAADLAAEIANLKAQIAALKKADGAESATGVETKDEDGYNAARAYKELKGIL